MDRFNPFTAPGFLIRRLHQVSVRLFQDATAPFGISTMQYGALQVIGARPGIDQLSLSEATDIDRTTIVRVVDRLQEGALILRTVAPKDRRSNTLTITDGGRKLLHEVYEHAQRSQAELLAPLAPSEQREFMNMLMRLVNAHSAGKRQSGQGASKRSNRSTLSGEAREP